MALVQRQFTLKEANVIRFSLAERTSEYCIVSCSVLSQPQGIYLNFKPYDFNSFFGYVQEFAKTYVVKKTPIEYVNQILYERNSIVISVAQQLRCDLDTTKNRIVQDLQGTPTGANLSDQPLKFYIPVVEGLAFRLLTGVSVLVTIVHEADKLSSCKYPVAGEDPSEGLPAGVNNPTSIPPGGSGEAPYGVGSDAPNGLSDDEEAPEAVIPDAVPGQFYKVSFYAPSANTGLPCGQEETQFSGFINVPSQSDNPDITFGTGSTPREYCGKPLSDGFEVFVDGVSIGFRDTGASHFVTPVITSVEKITPP